MFATKDQKQAYQYNELEKNLYAIKDAVKWIEWHKALGNIKLAKSKKHYILNSSLSRNFFIGYSDSNWLFGVKELDSLIWFVQIFWEKLYLSEKLNLLCFHFPGFNPQVLKLEQTSPALTFNFCIPCHPIIMQELISKCKTIHIGLYNKYQPQNPEFQIIKGIEAQKL